MNEYGRFQLRINTEAGTASLLLENVNRKGEHWLTLALPVAPTSPVGYLRLRPVNPGSDIFEIVEVRPANGPLLRSLGESLEIADPSPEGSE